MDRARSGMGAPDFCLVRAMFSWECLAPAQIRIRMTAGCQLAFTREDDAMTTATAVASYPDHLELATKLVEYHKTLTEDPLQLAIYYAPERDSQDMFLLEVLQDFGTNEFDTEPCFFEVTFEPSNKLPLKADQKLHMTLTSPEEFVFAAEHNWPSFRELHDAYKNGRAQILFDAGHLALMDQLNA
jgi:hypothetical protein